MSSSILNSASWEKINIKDFYNIHEFEILLIGHILNYKITEAKELYDDFFSKEYIYNISSDDELQYLKNYMISLSFLICHSVIIKGVSPYKAKAKQHSFAKLIQKLMCKEKIIEFGKVMIEAYIEQLRNITHNSDNAYIRKALNYIQDNLEENISLEMVAEHVKLSKCYFCSQFKKELNMSFADYVSYLRVEKSKYLLENTEKSILDIAISVGFNSQSYFTTQFKKFTNLSPKDYRNKKKLPTK